jgi:hypothetical protein
MSTTVKTLYFRQLRLKIVIGGYISTNYLRVVNMEIIRRSDRLCCDTSIHYGKLPHAIILSLDIRELLRELQS